MNKRPAHTVTLEPWRGGSFGERVALEMTTMLLWPLDSDSRMTVVLTLLSAEIARVADNDDAVDAILDMIRLKLKLRRASPSIQNYEGS